MKVLGTIFLVIAALTLGACGTAQLPDMPGLGDHELAARVLERSIDAHGGAARWAEIRDVVARYDGEWASIGPRLQPVLSDTKYRRSSVEVILPSDRIVGQRHEGPSGTKQVYRTPTSVEADYDGVPATDATVLDAAALVADAYQMFLTAPFYFASFAGAPVSAGTETIDGELCDRIGVEVRPGFGRTDRDLALLSIGRESGIVRRVRFTLEGLASTRGAEVDVTFRAHREIDGILWATEYVERIRAPFRLPAHRWRLVSLETNTGADPREPGR
jgi:hypothetical protein